MSKRIYLGTILILLFVLLYIPSLINWLSGSRISSDIIRIGTIEESISAEGILVRDEVLLKPPSFEGRYTTEIGEGEKTPAFSSIATVYNSTSDSLLTEMGRINTRIVKARMETAEKSEFYSADLEKLDEDIGLKVQSLITACNNQNFDNIGRYRNEIDEIVEKKAEIVGEHSTDAYVRSLEQQKVTVQNKLNLNTAKMISPISGIVSYAIDGYEQILKPANLKTLTPEQLDTIKSKQASKRENADKASSEKPLAKIIRGTDIYIAVALKTADAQKYKPGKRIDVRINDIALETDGEITNVNKPVNSRSVVVIKISMGADTLSSVREVNVDLINKTGEGLKVPLNCLRSVSADGKTARIMLIKGDVASSRVVDILCRDAEFAIIKTPDDEMKKTVNLYDTYIVNPDHVTEGDIMEK